MVVALQGRTSIIVTRVDRVGVVRGGIAARTADAWVHATVENRPPRACLMRRLRNSSPHCQ